MDKKNLFSSGEFAKINGINKRTLHYYNDIGLFCPAIIDENGYHYYSSFQSIQLEMILIFRKLGLSIDDIKTYTNSPSDTSFLQMIADKKKLIDKSIEQLLEAKSFLQEKQNKLELGMSAYHGKIELVELPERPILLSSPIKGIYDEEDFATATEFSLHLKKIFGLYDNFGSRISLQNLYEENYQRSTERIPLLPMTLSFLPELICAHLVLETGISLKIFISPSLGMQIHTGSHCPAMLTKKD